MKNLSSATASLLIFMAAAVAPFSAASASSHVDSAQSETAAWCWPNDEICKER